MRCNHLVAAVADRGLIIRREALLRVQDMQRHVPPLDCIRDHLQQPIEADGSQKHPAHKRIRIEEGAVDRTNIVERASAAVLIDERRCDWNHRGEVHCAELRNYSETNQCHEH